LRTGPVEVHLHDVDARDLISVSDANSKGIAAVVVDAERGRSRIIVRNSGSAAAVVNVEEYDRLEDMGENLVLMVESVVSRNSLSVKSTPNSVAARLRRW